MEGTQEEISAALDRVEEAQDAVLIDARQLGQDEKALTELVHIAHDLGATWDEVGRTLGITRQSAWQRFHR